MLAHISTCKWVQCNSLVSPFRHHTTLIGRTHAFRKPQSFRGFQTARPRLEEIKSGVPTQGLTTEVAQLQTAMLYLDNVFPLRLNKLDIRQLLFRSTKHSLEAKAHKSIPTEGMPHNFKIADVIPRKKDGGAIVRFTFTSTPSDKKEAGKEITSKVFSYIENHSTLAAFNFQPMRAFYVKGQPFMEDLVARYPTQRLRVEFQGAPVEIEKLYKQMRTYGRIYDISMYPNPIVSKDPVRYAIVSFTKIRSATSARNCLHGHTVGGTRLNVLYEQQLNTNVVKDWIVGHPRISIPIIAAFVATVTYAVFDPIRVFFITSKITHRFNLDEYAFYRWLRSETWARLVPTDREPINRQSVWTEDSEQIERLKSWVQEKPETFGVVSGPKGSGKSALVMTAMEGRRNKILIDCEELSNARNKSELTKMLAKEVGYFPLFTWISSMSGLIETLVTATTGQKAGLSTSPDSQIQDILETLAISLREIAPKQRPDKSQKDKPSGKKGIFDQLLDFINFSDAKEKVHTLEEKASLHSNKEDSYNKEDIPVVIIDNFMYRETAKNSSLWEELADWSSILIENEIAHVIFITANPSATRLLSKSLPGKSFSSIILADAPTEMALMFITKQLGDDVVDDKLTSIVNALGGRLTELELLTAKMKAHMEPEVAFNEIVSRNVIEILKYGLGDISISQDNRAEWSPSQFWAIVKGLSDKKHMNYDELKWTPLFNGDEKPLREMERAEMITIIHHDGRPYSIRPGKPVFYTAFKRLTADSVFAASMDIEYNTQLRKIAEANIAKYEDNIIALSNVYYGRPPREINDRIRALLAKVAKTQKLIEEYEANISEAKKIISKDWQDE
ncbi:RNA12 protein-domain-containing protein [Phycomyces nitens]|nr:RNA12 protein-domain-containing protein [Phycomyces nitens]